LKKNELVGIFLLFDTKPRSFIQEEIAFLEAMSSQIGNAIEKARLYKDVVDSHRQMTESKQQSDLLTDLMSYDIRNYEQIVQGSLDFALMDGSLSNETREYVQKAFEASQGTARIIENVKKLGRLGKYKDVQNRLSSIDIVERIEECAEVVKGTYAKEKRQIEIRITTQAHDDGKQPIEVPADEFIDDIFLNLLENAIKYDNSDEVQIDVTVEKDSLPLLVSVADHGRGVPDDKKKLIFQRYTLMSSGSGLGLSICKAVVERYGGKIWVENRIKGDYSKGSTFKVELPLTSAKEDNSTALRQTIGR
jgi:K+-sensing histidine kinase KdpD